MSLARSLLQRWGWQWGQRSDAWQLAPCPAPQAQETLGAGLAQQLLQHGGLQLQGSRATWHIANACCVAATYHSSSLPCQRLAQAPLRCKGVSRQGGAPTCAHGIAPGSAGPRQGDVQHANLFGNTCCLWWL